LKQQESEIQERIQRALEKENLDKEAGKDEKDSIRSSVVLQQELAEVTRKVEEHRERRDIEKNFPEVLARRNELIACYRSHKDRPLDCWSEASEFRLAVKKAEQVGLDTSPTHSHSLTLRCL
jgi:altered-inheritance-of-mitochondria protein 13